MRANVRTAFRAILPGIVCLVAGFNLASPAHAQTVDFTGITLANVSSAGGQNFTTAGGTVVNVRLISGTVTSVQTGLYPDPTGFLAGQDNTDLTPYTFRFTMSAPLSYQITQNETLTSYETNTFTMPSGNWTGISSTNATVTNSGSQISFAGTTYTPPYGTYALSGAGSSFDFMVSDSPGIVNYGSAISLKLNSNASAPEPSSLALFALSGLSFAGTLVRRGRRHGTA